MAIMQADSEITLKNHIDHFLIRWGYRRGEHRVEPGLYALGHPGKESPVFVTANYTLSFDALRSALKGVDCYLLVLDTYGINVWCAAGKGTFGTEELVRRIEATGLADVVSHRKIVLPQLGAPGVRSFEVTKRTGFRVEYGPVKAGDLAEYLKAGKATPEMRRVRFPLIDRIVLIPVELVSIVLPAIVLAVLAFLGLGWPSALGLVTAVLAGTVFFPALLPYLPTKDYSTKGLLLGFVLSLPFVAYAAGERVVGRLADVRVRAHLPAGDDAGGGLPGAELHRLDALPVPDRRPQRDLHLHPGDGGPAGAGRIAGAGIDGD